MHDDAVCMAILFSSYFSRHGQCEELSGGRAARGEGGKRRLHGLLKVLSRGQPDRSENRRYGCGYCGLQKRERTHVAEQATMFLGMMGLFLGGEREGLTHQRKADQDEYSYPDNVFARGYVLRLTEKRQSGLWEPLERESDTRHQGAWLEEMRAAKSRQEIVQRHDIG